MFSLTLTANDLSLGESEAIGQRRESARRSSAYGNLRLDTADLSDVCVFLGVLTLVVPAYADPLTHVLLRRSLNIRDSEGRQSEGPPVELDAYENRWLR